MGGHGALTLYLSSKSKQYKSASAFAPVSNPSKSPWGQKAFKGYLQGGVDEGIVMNDATELVAMNTDPGSLDILVDYVGIFCFLLPSLLPRI
jgi:S-formylglutathione hydrolase